MKSKQIIACITGMALLMGVLTGCGNERGGQEGNVDSHAEQQKGSYVEEEVETPSEWEGWTAKQIFVSEDKAHILLMKEEAERSVLQEWEYSDGSFADVTESWLSTVELPPQAWMNIKLVEDESGTGYLLASYVKEGEDSYQSHLWRSDGETAKDITPASWTVLNEEWGSYDIVRDIAALGAGKLAAYTALSFNILSGEDGSVLESGDPLGYSYDVMMLSDGKNLYLPTRENGNDISGIEKWTEGKASTRESISFDSNGAVNTATMCVTAEGVLFTGSPDGLYQYKSSDTGWEKLLSGTETSFALSTCWCVGMAALSDDTIYGLFSHQDGSFSVKRYWFNPEAVNEVTEVLKLYAVQESALLQNAAALYHKAHPEVMIEMEYAYSLDEMYSGVVMDYNEVYQQLNTVLMSDLAPDILVLDHLDISSYADKGLLIDLQDVAEPLERSGEILSNITSAYVQEDGSRYIVPLQFGFSVALGRDITGADMQSLETLASFLEGKTESYLGEQTVADLVDKFYPFFCSEIVSDGQLDKEVLEKKLECLKKIADNSGVVEKYGEERARGYGMWDLASYVKLAFSESSGFQSSMFEMAMVDYIKGDFTAFENCFIPSNQTAVSSKSKYQDRAKDFLRFALSEEIQGTDYYMGYPVNSASLEKLARKDRSDMSAYTMIVGDDGSEVDFEINPYSQETTEKLVALCKKLDRPVAEDAKIREVLIESLRGFLMGSQTMETTVAQIEGGLKMYLAE